jgi:hypothetical protein
MLQYHQKNLPDSLSEIVRKLIQHEQQPALEEQDIGGSYNDVRAATPDIAGNAVVTVTPPSPMAPRRIPTNASLTVPGHASPLRNSVDASNLSQATTLLEPPSSGDTLRRRTSLTRKRLSSSQKNTNVDSADSGTVVNPDGVDLGTLV